jgi:hypothetical protein
MDVKTFEEIKQNIKRVSRPHAAVDIARQILAYL